MSGRRGVQRLTRRFQFGAVVVAATLATATVPSSERFAEEQTISLGGMNFAPGITAYADGFPLVTSYVSPSSATAILPESYLYENATLAITVQNTGTTASAAQNIVVTQPADLECEPRVDRGRTMNAGTIQVLADQSGKGDANRNFSNLTAAQQPTLSAADAAWGGQDVATLDGGDHLVSGTWAASLTQPIRVYYVGQNTGSFVTAAYLFDGIVNGSRNAIFRSAAGTSALFAGFQVNSAAWDTTTKAAICAHYEGTSSKLAVSARTFGANVNAGTNGLTGMTIGASYLLGNKQTGVFAHALVFSSASAISAARHGRIMTYLGAKYAVTIGA